MANPTAKNFLGYNLGDTWCSGSFTLKEVSSITDLILEYYDIPAWPELLAFGDKETLQGFWLPLYKNWLDPQGLRVQIDHALSARPGIKLFNDRFVGSPLNVIKGQMIGPATLKWGLLKTKSSLGSDDHIVNFIVEAAIAQIQVLSKFSWNVVLTFDEPSAGFVDGAEELWRDVLVSLDKYKPYGVALHCCGPVKLEWLEWPWQVVHFDIHECLNLWSAEPQKWTNGMEKFFSRGSWIAAGALTSNSLVAESFDPLVFTDFLETIRTISGNQILLSSSCGIDCVTEVALRQRLNSFTAVNELLNSICKKSNPTSKSI